jgi:4-hydroxythreonine-4-phosphate dehydrogenase
MKPVIACTIGDPNGIGTEVILKALCSAGIRRTIVPLLVGPPELFEREIMRLRLPLAVREVLPGGPAAITRSQTAQTIPVVRNFDGTIPDVRYGVLNRAAGHTAAAAIITAAALTRAGIADGIVTAPVSKKALHLAGIDVPGQTEFLQRLTGAREVLMMLAGGTMRIALATIHLPLKNVARTLTKALLRDRIAILREALIHDMNIRTPRIAVLGLNPHAGENGDLGDEETRVIKPVIATMKRRGWKVDGPFPADAFFARYDAGSQDAIIAMYHDQGLIPLKFHARGRGVNVSLGLPIVRTSPDHGTAFDIAGQGIADPSSTIEAIRLAVRIIHNRRTGSNQ